MNLLNMFRKKAPPVDHQFAVLAFRAKVGNQRIKAALVGVNGAPVCVRPLFIAGERWYCAGETMYVPADEETAMLFDDHGFAVIAGGDLGFFEGDA